MICVGLDLNCWETAREYLQQAIRLNGGALTADDVYNAIASKDMQLWGVHNGDLKSVIVTEIINYPSRKRLNIVLIGGHEIEDWESIAESTLCEFAKENMCDSLQIIGRRGWVKRMAKYGYKEYATVVIKDI